MKLQSWHIVGFVLALSTLVAAAARPIAANGTTDASVLGSIVSPADWDQDAAVLEYSGSNDGAFQRDGSLAAAAASILGSAPAGLPGPRPASAMTRDRIDNNVCIVLSAHSLRLYSCTAATVQTDIPMPASSCMMGLHQEQPPTGQATPKAAQTACSCGYACKQTATLWHLTAPTKPFGPPTQWALTGALQ